MSISCMIRRDVRDNFLDAIVRGRVAKANRIREANTFLYSYSSPGANIYKYALKANIKTINFVASPHFKIDYSDLTYLLDRKPCKEVDDILEYLLANYTIKYDIIFSNNFEREVHEPIYHCKSYRQVCLLVEYGLSRLSVDVLIHYLNKGRDDLVLDLRLAFNFYEQNENGDTVLHQFPLSLYFLTGRFKIKELLLKYPDLTIKNNRGISIFRAIWPRFNFESDVEIEVFILDTLGPSGDRVFSFNINDVDEYGQTILFGYGGDGYKSSKRERIFKLIDLGADVFIRDSKGRTILDFLPKEFVEKIMDHLNVPEIKGAI